MQSFSQQLYEQSIHYKKSNIENYSIYDAIIEVANLDPEEYYVHHISTRSIVFFNKANYRKFIGFQYNPQRLFVIMNIYKYANVEEDFINSHESLVNEIKNFTPLFFLNNKNEAEDFYLSITNDDINGLKKLKEIETIKDNPFFYEKSIEDARLPCRIKYVKTISFSPENLEHKFYIEYIFIAAHIKHRFNIDLHVDDFNFLFLDTVVNELFTDSFSVSNPSIFDQIQFDETIGSQMKQKINLVKIMNKTFDDICGLEYDMLMEKEIISILGFDASVDKPYMISNKLLNIDHDKFYKTSIFFSEKETTVTIVFSEDSEEDCCFFEKKKEITKKTNYVYNLFCDIKSIDTNSYFSIDDKEYNLNKFKSINANNQKVFYCFNDDDKPNILNVNYLYTIAAIHLNKGVLLKIDDYLFLEKYVNSLVSALNIKKMRNSNPLFELLFFNNENKLTKESKELVELNYGY